MKHILITDSWLKSIKSLPFGEIGGASIKHIYIYFLAGFLLFVSNSCSDYLEVDYYDILPGDYMFESEKMWKPDWWDVMIHFIRQNRRMHRLI